MTRYIILFTTLLLLSIYKVPAQLVVGDSTLREAETKSELENTAPLDDRVSMKERTFFKIGGALRYNYQFRDWSKSHRKQGGAFTFDTWRINVDGQSKGILLSLEYRFYSGFHMFHHGWFGYNITPDTQIQLGINKVPFGIIPFASHSWWFQTPYYVGLEDDYDMGIKVTNTFGKLDLDLAYYKTAEPSISGSSLASARYSYDVVPASRIQFTGTLPTSGPLNPNTPGPDEDTLAIVDPIVADTLLYSANSEANQFNLRAAYNVNDELQIGISGEYGGIYNQDTDEMGNHWANAVHLKKQWGNYEFLAEYVYYQYNLPESPGNEPGTVVMGAYDAPYRVATEAQMIVVGLSYILETDWGPVSSLTFYNNYTYMDKINPEFRDTQQNVLGCLISAGQLFTYVDLAAGQNHPWLGPYDENWNTGLSEGASGKNRSFEETEWHVRFNINFGYYF